MTVVEAGRTAAEALMEDTCTIAAAGADVVYDSGTDSYVADPGSSRYSGKCRVRMPGVLSEASPQFAGREVTLQTAVISVPVSVTGVQVGDVVTITAVAVGGDGDLVGRTYTVVGLHHQTHMTARRLRCEEVTRA